MLQQLSLGVELVGVPFWIASLYLFIEPSPRVVLALHGVALFLSLVLPVYVVTSDAVAFPASVSCGALGVLNGILATHWCERVGKTSDTELSRWPIVGITLAGLVLELLSGWSRLQV
jgi:hypothetical protein